MKPFLPLLALLLIRQVAVAAPYDCFLPGQRQFFVNDNEYVRGIEVKNVQTFSDHRIYSLFKTLRGGYSSVPQTILVPGGSWMGDDVIVYDDGLHTIETMWGDTVYIKSRALVGEEWIFHTGSNAPEYFKAKVVSIDTMTVSGSIDSVKIISINAYYNKVPVADPLNGFTLKLSKDHGFVEAFELYTFPYHAPGQPIQKGADYYFDEMGGVNHAMFHICSYEPADNKLHDWQPGDVLEYTAIPMFYGPYPNADIQVYYIDTIISRQDGAGWVSYQTRGWRSDLKSKTTTYPIKRVYEKTPTSAIRYYDSNWLLAGGYMPEEVGYFNLLYYREADTSYCFTGKWYMEKIGDVAYTGGQYQYFPPFEWYYDKTYKERIGLVEYFAGNIDNTTDTTLCYTMLNGAPCGKFTDLGTDDIPAPNNSIYLWPNPAQNTLSVELPDNTSYMLAIVNMQGATLSKNYTNKQKNRFEHT